MAGPAPATLSRSTSSGVFVPQSLQRLVYESTATGSTESLLNIATILGESQRNNDRDGLTGALAAHKGRFVQVVEGEAARLDALLNRLARDPRHRDIRLIDRQSITERLFGQWSMASLRTSPDMADMVEAVMDRREHTAHAIVTAMLDGLKAEPAAV
jgi:hypothetical protein